MGIYILFLYIKRIPHQSMNGCRLSVILQRDLRLDAAGIVQTRGVMCVNCGVECCDYALTYDYWEAIISYMQKNKMPRTLETYKQVIKFMHDRRKNLY